jgi:L-malate glycosyltransferase
MRRVLIIETQLQHYRRRFFQELARALEPSQIQLQIAYSGEGELAGLGIEIASRSLFGGRLVIQNAWAAARDADLVIVDQSNRLAFNALLLAVGRPRMAYWGHGYNHQAARFGISEWLKRKLLRRADWWFAYTPGVSRYLAEHGVSA